MNTTLYTRGKTISLKIITKMFSWLDPQDHTLSIQLDITNACNLDCKHCYHAHHKNLHALTFPQWVLVLTQYKKLLRKVKMKPRITICGGEPLLCPFLFSLIQEIRTNFGSCHINLLTNGTLITEEIAKKLKDYSVFIQVSIDGPNAEIHNSMRGRCSFEKALIGCSFLKKYNISFVHLAVLSRRSTPFIKDFFKLAHLTGAEQMNFTRLILQGHAEALPVQGLDEPLQKEELKNAMQTILKYSRLSKIPTSTKGELWHLIEDDLGSPNNIGFSGFIINYQGEFKVSSRTSLSLGNVFKEDMGSIFLYHPIMTKLRKNEIEGCGKCIHINKCRGNRNVSFATFGHFLGPDIGCWLLS